MWPPKDNLDEWADNIVKPLGNVWVPGSVIRAIAKAISYRIANSLITVVVAYIITENMSIACAIGGIEILVKTLIYYIHERMWTWWSKKE